MFRSKLTLLLATPVIASCALLASLAPVGAADPAKVTAGTYKVDPAHTQVKWAVSHFGFNDYFGLLGDATGSLTIDPANLAAAKVSITIPMASNLTSSSVLTDKLKKADNFNVEKFPTATFESTAVAVSGNTAKITGNLSFMGVTKPVVLDTTLSGAGKNPFNGKDSVGFHATTTLKRSEWGYKNMVPAIGDDVKLDISVAFEK